MGSNIFKCDVFAFENKGIECFDLKCAISKEVFDEF